MPESKQSSFQNKQSQQRQNQSSKDHQNQDAKSPQRSASATATFHSSNSDMTEQLDRNTRRQGKGKGQDTKMPPSTGFIGDSITGNVPKEDSTKK
jgi:hypothetical protein